MKMTTSRIIIAIAFVIVSVCAKAGSHVNLSSDPSDYADPASFYKMCTEYNAELPNVDAVCRSVELTYFK